MRPKDQAFFAIEDSESQIPIRMHPAVKISPNGEEEGEERLKLLEEKEGGREKSIAKYAEHFLRQHVIKRAITWVIFFSYPWYRLKITVSQRSLISDWMKKVFYTVINS